MVTVSGTVCAGTGVGFGGCQSLVLALVDEFASAGTAVLAGCNDNVPWLSAQPPPNTSAASSVHGTTTAALSDLRRGAGGNVGLDWVVRSSCDGRFGRWVMRFSQLVFALCKRGGNGFLVDT